MKLPDFLQRKLHWINLPGGLLVALLQRTPVLPVAVTAGRLTISSPIVAVLKSAAAALASLGALHSLAGATTLTTNSHASPLNVTAGVVIPQVVFGVAGTQAPAASWQVSGTIAPGLSFQGLTSPGSINFSNPSLTGTPTTAGTYVMQLQCWEGPNKTLISSPVFSYAVIVTGSVSPPPAIAIQPLSATVNGGGTVAFTVTATNSPSYQWRKNGANISGATSDTLILSSVGAGDAASYTVVVTTSGGSATSNAAVLAVTSGQVSRISNMSVRTNLASGQGLTVGFVTSGSKQMLVRADGPALGAVFGVTSFFADPQISILTQQGATLGFNDDWNSSLAPVFASLGAFAFVPGSKDAALLLSINGPVTAQVGGTGTGLITVEVYDDDAATAPARLTNVSARNQVGTGSNILISGFVVDGSAARTLLFRGIGPALHDVFGVTGNLADPLLEIHQTINGVDTTIASNDNWNASLTAVFDQVGAYHFNVGSKDAALVVTLPPGVYTAQVSGVNSGTGDGVVEVYVVP